MKQIDFSQLALLNGRTEQSLASISPTLAALSLTTRRETTHHLRDGEVVLYLRPGSAVWQVRYKLFDRRHCVTTRQRQLEWAKRVVGEIYDRARFREEEDLPHPNAADQPEKQAFTAELVLKKVAMARRMTGYAEILFAVKPSMAASVLNSSVYLAHFLVSLILFPLN